MKMNRLWSMRLIVSLAVILPLTKGYPGASVQPKSGGVLRVGLLRDITILNPFVEHLSSNARVRAMVYPGLVDVDKNAELLPNLAESWSISRDGKEYTFHLRKGVLFHNGKELDSEDVKWSLDYAIEPKNRAYMRGTLSIVDKVEAVDQHTVRLALKQPFAPLLAIGLSNDTVIIPKNSIHSSQTITVAPPGTGPYQFVEWKPGNQIRLIANRKYWKKGLPHLDEVIFKPIPSEDVRFLALRAGDLDVVEVLPYAVVDDIKKGKYPEIKLSPATVGGFRMIKMNVEVPYFNDAKVRRAVAYAIDRQGYIDGVAFGHGEPAYQVNPRGHKWYFNDVKNIEMNLEQAKALMAEAGYPNGFKSFLESRRGEEGEAAIIQSQLKKIGIELEIKSMDFAQLRKVTLDGTYHIRASGSDVYPDIDRALHTNFHSEGKRRIRNHTGYKNRRVDELLDAARSASTTGERRELYKKATEIINNESPQVNLAFIVEYFGYRANVKGFSTNPNGKLFFAEGGIPYAWLE